MLNERKNITNEKISDDLIYSFRYYFVNDRNINNIELNQDKSNIVVIDKYNYTSENKMYYIICFSNILLIVQQSDFSKLSYFFTSNINQTIFCLSNNIHDDIKSVFFQKNLKTSSSDLTYVNELIFDFSQNFNINNLRAKRFFKIIEKCLFAYLIQKGFINSNIDRIQNYSKLFEQEKPFTTDYFIRKCMPIKWLSTTNLSQVYLYYNIEQYKFFILKTVLNNTSYLHSREKNAYSEICNPFIPKFFGEINESDHYKIVIEFIKGKTLKNLDQLNLNESDKINIIFELMITIQYFHSKHYLYRDLKPENIIIDDYKNAVIIDFNKMNKDDNDNEVSTDFSHSFCAPEIVENKPYSNKCDIYSLGLIIIYILTGKMPSDYHHDNLRNDLTTKLINRCIDKNPENRPSITRLINEFFLIILSENYVDFNVDILIIYTKNVKNEKYDQSIFHNHFLLDENMIYAPKNLEYIMNNYHIAALKKLPYKYFIYGFLFLKGIFVSKDISRAFDFYIDSAKKNS